MLLDVITRCFKARGREASPDNRSEPRPFAAIAVLIVGFMMIANAPPRSGLEGLGPTVSDERLGDMRGKFVRADDISFFGITMATSWQDANNTTVSAVLVFSLEFVNGAGSPADAKPFAAVSWDRACNGCGDPAMDVPGGGSQASLAQSGQAIPVGGLNSANGAVQTQQVAGNDNGVTNGMQISVLPVEQARQNTMNGLTMITESEAHSLPDGGTLSFMLDDNRVGISVMQGEHDLVSQGVDGALGQASQHVMLNSDLNRIHNTMSIMFGTQGGDPFAGGSTDSSVFDFQGHM